MTSAEKETEGETRKRTLLIDASPFIFKAFSVVPILNDSAPLNAVHGFIRTLLKLVREHPSDYIGALESLKYEKKCVARILVLNGFF